MGYYTYRKNTNRVAGLKMDMEFLGVLKKKNVKIAGVSKIRRGIFL